MNPTFETLLDTSFEEIRRNASGNARVIISMLDALKLIGATSPLVSHKRALGEQAKKVAELAEGNIESTHDLAAIRARLETLHIAVDPNPPTNR